MIAIFLLLNYFIPLVSNSHLLSWSITIIYPEPILLKFNSYITLILNKIELGVGKSEKMIEILNSPLSFYYKMGQGEVPVVRWVMLTFYHLFLYYNLCFLFILQSHQFFEDYVTSTLHSLISSMLLPQLVSVQFLVNLENLSAFTQNLSS